VLEISMLRSMRRGLETGSQDYRASPRPYRSHHPRRRTKPRSYGDRMLPAYTPSGGTEQSKLNQRGRGDVGSEKGSAGAITEESTPAASPWQAGI